jgi:2-(3-amino-3-carboxypropyl)histidine synthase
MEIKLAKLEEKYNLKEDFIKLEKRLKKQKPDSILLQFPDGLKPYSTEIVKKVKEIAKNVCKKDVSIKIWLGSCFGACDIPNSKADLLVQFGHAPWNV